MGHVQQTLLARQRRWDEKHHLLQNQVFIRAINITTWHQNVVGIVCLSLFVMDSFNIPAAQRKNSFITTVK